MNMGLKILLLHAILIGCASTPKPAVKKKVGTTAPAGKAVKGAVPAKPSAAKPTAVKPVTPPPPAEEEEVHEEEEDDQFSRIKKYYKK